MNELDDNRQKQTVMRSSVRTILITVLVLCVILGTLFLWRMMRNGSSNGWSQQPTEVAAMVVTPRQVPVYLEAVGSLRAVREVVLSAETAGRVTAIHFDAGHYVRAGALLVRLFDGPEQAEKKAAEVQARLARLKLARSEKLVPLGAQSAEILDQQRAERDAALATVGELDARLVQKQIRAPFSGEIGIRHVNLGQYLNPGDAITSLTDLSSLYVDFDLPQQDFSLLHKGALVHVASDAFPGRVFVARVNALEPQVDRNTRNIRVQAILSNDDRALRPGMYVTASLVLAPQDDALVVPATAIQTSAQGSSVLVIRGDKARNEGKTDIVPVTVGRRIGNDVIVTSGLKPGDVIITEGQLRVIPGSEVKVLRIVPGAGESR